MSGRFDDLHEPGAQREDADEQLGQVAERALQHAGRAGAEAVAELVDAAADEGGQSGDRET